MFNHTLLRSPRIALLSLIAACGLTTSLFGQDAGDLFAGIDTSASTATNAPAGKDSGLFELQLSDLMESTLHFSVNPDHQDYNSVIKTPTTRNTLGFQVKSGTVKLVSNWIIDVQPSSTSATILSAIAGENAIYWNPQAFKLGLGWQEYAWGVADKQNPTDNLNPRDYTVGVTPDKLAVFSLSANWYPTDNLTVEGVFVPFKQQDKFPMDFAGSARAGLAKLNPAIQVNVNEPAMDPASFIAGGRLAFRLPSVDFSFSYLYDWDQFYSPTVTMANAGMYLPAVLTLDKQRVQRIGADVKTVIQKSGLWLEACLNLTQDLQASNNDNIRNPSVAWTAGFDTNYGPNDSFYLNLQYIGQYVVNYDQSYGSDYSNPTYKFNPLLAGSAPYMQAFYNRSLTQALGIQTEGLTQGLTLNLKFPLLDSLITPSLTAAYLVPFLYDNSVITRYGSLALNPELDIMPVDSLHIIIGANLCYAWISKNGVIQQDSNDRIGVYGADNNVYLKVEYAFNYLLKK